MAEVFFLIVLIGIGGWILYEDFKVARIRNSLLLVLIVAGIFLNYYTEILVTQPFPFLVNVFFGIAVGLIIWFAGLWSAADAKLYMSLVILFPIIWLKPSAGYFPGLAILINSTMPLFIFLAGQVLIQSKWVEKIQALKKVLKPQIIANIFIISMGVVLLRSLLAEFFQIKVDYFLTLPLFLGIFWLVGKLKIKTIYLFLFIIIFSVLFTSRLIDLQFFAIVIIFSLLLLSAIWIISLSQPLFTREVKITELEEGMILNEMILRKNQNFVKEPLAFLTFLTSLTQRMNLKPIFGYNPDGLKINEVKKIQEMERAGQLEFGTIKVAKTLPFAQALFLGTLITYLLKGSFFSII
jgi:hypothetical protein